MGTRRPVSFKSGKWTLKGYLHEPAGAPPFACLVMCHGFSGTMDRLQDHAAAFSEAGFAVLTFDYRNFGESGGKPRQVISIERQLNDIAAAIAFVRAQSNIDSGKVVLWGSSLGGGHVVVAAARDKRVAAVISQVPFNGFPKKVEGMTAGRRRQIVGAMLKDWLRGKLGLSPVYMAAVGHKGEFAVMASDDAAAAVEAMSGGGATTWQNKVAPRILLEMVFYKPGNFAPFVSAPLLVCMAEGDKETPPETVRELAEKAPRGELRRYPIRHFEIYREDIRDMVLRDQIAFLKTHLFVAG
ncbi:alpha/beta hydrolase fold [Parvibaculum lavamentivorans DS-1]|uniref:Alpha/beta hydrolase fold n=1 Tax=Parvibaculum lavamentivorans (strain DS-1 / DSM 13023 / NCIMB 13966) TaxID=402881 RepID=A7HX26_PARL1|nr:alpha/beta fold hydrolase [Parvibaculum lavamentivorans]ABS64459.1 alpha/beta hydrolase fold [Parvibaculum lavamentivorans DS-1]